MNKEISVEDLSDQKLLLTYESDGMRNVFYGQFSKTGHWDGECIINSYKDEQLDFMADAIYDDGELVRYKQVFRKKESDEPIWVISIRRYGSGSNPGESWEYERIQEIPQDFELATVDLSDIVYPAQFIKGLDTALVAYYKGDTSGGDYNDISGNAFLIHYLDGKIRMFQKGKFINGKLEESDGDNGISWEIIWNGVNAYNYYRGNFSDGKKDDEEFTETNISINRIKELTLGISFDFTDLWMIEDETLEEV